MQKGFKEILIEELRDLLSAEEQIIKALPKMAAASHSPDLKKAFENHLKETKEQVHRLKKVFTFLKIAKKAKFCKGVKGLIDEGKEVIKEFKKKSAVRDAALISKAQRIEHYEIAGYGTVRTFAKELGFNEVSHLLQETLNEEGNADKKLTKIAEGGLFKLGVNYEAMEPAPKAPKKTKKKVSKPKKAKAVSSKKKVSKSKKAKAVSSKKKASKPKAKKVTKK